MATEEPCAQYLLRGFPTVEIKDTDTIMSRVAKNAMGIYKAGALPYDRCRVRRGILNRLLLAMNSTQKLLESDSAIFAKSQSCPCRMRDGSLIGSAIKICQTRVLHASLPGIASQCSHLPGGDGAHGMSLVGYGGT